MATKAFRSLSRFASTRGTIAPRRHALAIFKPFDRHDNLNSTLNPFMMKRRGPDLFSLVEELNSRQRDDKEGFLFEPVEPVPLSRKRTCSDLRSGSSPRALSEM